MSSDNMVMMYGVPPMGNSPRIPDGLKTFPPVVPANPVSQPMPGVQAMPPITHNPFTGEPVNLLEVLAQNALLQDEKRRLEEHITELKDGRKQDDEKIKQMKQLACVDRGTISTLETRCKALEFQAEQAKKKGKK